MALSCLMIGGVFAGAGAASASGGTTPATALNVRAAAAGAPPDHTTTPVKHVIEIMLENHSFDNLFGNFKGADGIPAGASLPNPSAYFTSAPDVSPVWAGQNEGDVQGAIDNSRAGEQMAMDYQPGQGYQMDNYTRYPYDGMSSITEFGPGFDPNLQYLASSYELADHNFQPAIAASNTNIHYALNATGNGWMYNNLQPGTGNSTWNSIFKEVDAAGLTSKLYYGLPASTLGQYWWQMFPPDRQNDATTDTQFLADAAAGNLPAFSILRPDYGTYSEEPPEDLEQGDAWLGQMLHAIAASPDWGSTAVFVTYDESGGFWDHVSPPVASQYGYGPRTPTVIVSPYARKGVFSRQITNMSVLSFVQHNWTLKPLNTVNASQDNLLSAFDFSQQPLPAPNMPQAPSDTIAFYDSTTAPGAGRTFTVNLQANTPALTADTGANGPVSLTVTTPPGVSVPSGFPQSVTLSGGKASFQASFPTAGYYRIAASVPGSALGWTTVDVGVNPNTAP